jgi:hypothetical protein
VAARTAKAILIDPLCKSGSVNFRFAPKTTEVLLCRN